MKLHFAFILLIVLGVGAQRRTSKSETETEASPHKPVGRGRARFSLSAESLEDIRTDSDRSAGTKSEKRKVERRISARPNSRPYEVEEIIDDIPNENARKLHKPRVITETRFEIANAPKKPLFIPVPLPEEELSPEELIASFGPTVINTEKSPEREEKKKTETPTTQKSQPVPVSSAAPFRKVSFPVESIETSSRIISSTPELTTASEQPSSTENEVKKIPLEIVTPITILPEPRKVSTVKTHVKQRVTSEEAVTSAASRSRTRGRPSRRQETDSSENTSSRLRSSDSGEYVPRARVTRRRLESADNSEIGIKGRGPSVLSTASSQELPTRSRTGRKITSLEGSSSEPQEVRAAAEKTYTIRSRRIETKTQQLHFESTNDLSKPASEERDEVISEESPTEINRVTKRRRPSQANVDESASKDNQSRRNSRTRNSRNRSAEAKQTTENRRDSGRRRNRKQEERSTPANDVNNENISSRANVIRSRKPEPRVNEVPITETIATKKVTEFPHLEKLTAVESDVLKSETVENRKFTNRFSHELFGSESVLESSDKQIEKTVENKRPGSRNRPETVTTESSTQKSDGRKKDVTTEGLSENNVPTPIVGRRKIQIDESSTQQAQAPAVTRKRDDALLIENAVQTTTEAKRQRARTETVDRNIPTFNSRKTDEVPLAENHIKTPKTFEQKRINSRIKEETSTQNVESTENKRSRSRTSDARRNNRKPEPRSEAKTIPNESNSRRRSQPKPPNTASAESTARDKFRTRTRPRPRFIPPIIDEQKLEVLPLFESEAKTVRPISDSSERRRFNSVKDDFVSASTTEHAVKSNNEIRKDFLHRRGQVVRVETVTEKSEEINIQKRKPIIRESVESEVSEGVSSRQLVSINKTGSDGIKMHKEKKVTIKVGTPKVTITEVVNVSRGNKKAEIKSTEDVDEESENYPEPFKALIQAKLNKQSKKVSRIRSSEESVRKGSEKVTTSSTSSSLSTQPTALSGRVEDVDNELVPKNRSTSTTRASIPKSTRRRFSLATKNPLTVDGANQLKKGSVLAKKSPHSSLHVTSQGSGENTSKDSRYHARFASQVLDKVPADLEHKLSAPSATGGGRSFPSKPPRAAYSTRASSNKKLNGNLRHKAKASKPDLPSVKISSLGAVTPKKPVRFSARYRSDIFSRTGSTRPTPAPVYIPTVPTVTPSSATQVKSGLAIEENVSGMEVISIDEPVNTIPSDSLVNGELLTPSNPFAPPPNLFPASLVTRNGASTTAQSIIPKTAEKPVSIIERIIYSITAISTTTAPDVTIDSILTNNFGPTRSSAIFKIPNKSTKTSGTTDITFDETLGRQDPLLLNRIESSTTEKPTTIIERILSSLSAIQADNSSVPQVGKNVSSISTTFTPIARFTSVSSTVSTSVPPDTSPSVDPLVVLEQITSEQSLQERTIAKLLELLKSITTSKQDDVVVVTPKVTTFVSSTPDVSTVVENPDVEVFNVSSNVITNNPEKQVAPTTTDMTSSSLSDAAPEIITTTTSATVDTKDASPSITENSIVQEIPSASTEAMSPQSLNSRFAEAISLTDYIASLTVMPESTSSTPPTSGTTPVASQEMTSSDNNQPTFTATPIASQEVAFSESAPTTTPIAPLETTPSDNSQSSTNINSSDETTLQSATLDLAASTEPSQSSANLVVPNTTEITGIDNRNSVDTDVSTETPNSVSQIVNTEPPKSSANLVVSNTTEVTAVNDINSVDTVVSTETPNSVSQIVNTEPSQTSVNLVVSATTEVNGINNRNSVGADVSTETPNSVSQIVSTEPSQSSANLVVSNTAEVTGVNDINSVDTDISTKTPNSMSQIVNTEPSQTSVNLVVSTTTEVTGINNRNSVGADVSTETPNSVSQIVSTEPSQSSANLVVSNTAEVTGVNDINSLDADLSTGTPNSARQISTDASVTSPINELNVTQTDKAIPENSYATTESTQTQTVNVTEVADTETKLNNSETINTTEPPQISENLTEGAKIMSTTQTVESSSETSAIESGESKTTTSTSSQAIATEAITTVKSNDTITEAPVNPDLPATTEFITNPTVEPPITFSEQLARLMAANLGTPSVVSTTLSIEQTSIRNPTTDSDTVATIPQLSPLMNFEANSTVQNPVSSVETNQLTVDATTSQPQPPPPPPMATLPTLTDLLGGKTVKAFNDIINQTNADIPVKVQTLDVDAMIQSRARDVEEVNIEENTISSSGNTGPEKLIEATTTPLPPITRPTSATTLTAPPLTVPVTNPPMTTVQTTNAPTTTVPPTTKPPTTTAPITILPMTTVPTNPPITEKLLTTTLPPTTLPTTPAQPIRTILPRIAEDLTTNPVTAATAGRPTQSSSVLTTQSVVDQTQTPPNTIMAERDVETTPIIDFVTIPAPTLASRIQEKITTAPSTPNAEPTTNQVMTTTPVAFERLRETIPTAETPSVIQRISKKPRNQQRTTPLTTQQLPRTRMRTIPTTTVEPSTITIPDTTTTIQARTTFGPIRTTNIAARRYTSTPTTVSPPRRRVTTFPPRIRLTTTPTITEQTVIANNYMTTPRVFEASTVFPIYTRPTVDYNSLETTNPPTTKFVTTFRSRGRQTGSTLPPDLTTILTTNQNLDRLARLRTEENYGELSTTGDYFNPTTVSPTTLQTTLKSINAKVRLLTDQQKKDLDELVKLEEEQKAILQQLAFLTRLNLGGGPKSLRSPSNLANRVLDFAAERNKVTTDAPPPQNILEALTASNSRESKKIASTEGRNPTVEEVLKQLKVNPNSVTASSLSSTYGKSTDAILAALLKEQGIGPNTPKALGDQLKTTTPFDASTTRKVVSTTKKRTTTTPRPGPIMQGLNWLLNALGGPQGAATSRRPPIATRRTPTFKPITAPLDVELLTNQPTEISPIVVSAPPRIRASASTEKQSAAIGSKPKRPLHSLSETELQSLITQLETIQKDPAKAKSLDFSALKLTEVTPKTTTIIANNAVQITNSGKVGSSSKLQFPSPETTTIKSDVAPSKSNGFSTTSNSILDDAKEETTKLPQRRPNLPPLRLSPVHGVDDEQEPQVRGQLINAAVNVTKAISQFLGSAIQDAAYQLTHLFSGDTENLRSYLSSSSVLPTITPRVNSSG